MRTIQALPGDVIQLCGMAVQKMVNLFQQDCISAELSQVEL